jgi:septal ring factor EnvC (AmiA/AmiB activator)
MNSTPGTRARAVSRCRRALLCALLCLGLVHLSSAAADSTAAAKAAELKQLRARIEAMRHALNADQGRRDRVRTELRKVEQTISHVAQVLQRTEQDIQQVGKRLQSLGRQRDRLAGDLTVDRRLLARQLRASYIIGRQQELKLLLNQSDPAKVQRALVYYDYLNRARTARIKSSLAQLRQLRSVQTAITDRRHQLQQLRAAQERQKTQLEHSRGERKQVLAQLSAQIADKHQRLRSMVRNEHNLEGVLHALDQALADIPMPPQLSRPFAKLKGRLPWPVRGRIVERYGRLRGVGRLRWRGMLIAAPAGTPVHAISHGQVAFADWLRGYGLLLIIDHGHGFMTLYGHNQSLYKEVGEWVEPGDLVASVGDSGGQAQSALYFEIRRQGNPVNPASWCRAGHGLMVGARR